MKYNPYIFGSLAQMNYDCINYKDIIRVEKNYQSIGTVNIICKPNYNIKQIIDYIFNSIDGRLDYKVMEEYSLVVI